MLNSCVCCCLSLFWKTVTEPQQEVKAETELGARWPCGRMKILVLWQLICFKIFKYYGSISLLFPFEQKAFKDNAGLSLAKQSQRVNLLYCADSQRRTPAGLCSERRLSGKEGGAARRKAASQDAVYRTVSRTKKAPSLSVPGASGSRCCLTPHPQWL